MPERFVAFFVDRHLLTNLLFLAVLAGGVLSWPGIKKEELPDVTFDRLRISANYPGATAPEVEHFVTRKIEEALQGLDGIYRISSTASQETTTVSVELEKDYPDKEEAIIEIRNAVLDVDLPEDVRDDPTVRVFKTARKAILDVALIHTGTHLLDKDQRRMLQHYAHALEDQLLSLPHVNSINKSGYFQEELQIKVNPEKLVQYAIPLSQIQREVTQSHARQPAGHIETKNEPKVTINAQLDSAEKLSALYVQGGFEGQAISLGAIAEVHSGFDMGKEIIKVNGHQAVMFNVVKNSGRGIVESVQAVQAAVERFRVQQLKDVPIAVVLLDDESIDVRNRLSIIAINGAIGFVLILVTLFLFLSPRAGLWVAMGIPFTIAFTLICGKWLGYTINNTTLAAVIIVMGIVVDDAIVVAENIGRFRARGLSSRDAAVRGTSQVLLPVLAAIVTTCIAFIPLFYFSGRFGALNAFIPPIIFLMLTASLIESLVVLPGHMHFRFPGQAREESVASGVQPHWFDRFEDAYGRVLVHLIRWKYLIFVIFIGLLVAAGWLAANKMKFVLFPDEETRDVVLSGGAARNADRLETAEVTRALEEVFRPYIGKEVVGYRTEIARSRRGGAVRENRFRMIVEIVPKEERQQSADELIALWKPGLDAVPGVEKLVVQKSRWGQSSGSAIEIVVQESDDKLRAQAAAELAERMRKNPALVNVEIDEPIRVAEYEVDLQRDKVKRLSINPADITATFRAALEGLVLYELPKGNEEIAVRLSIRDSAKADMETILNMPVENQQKYLVPLRNVVTIRKGTTPLSITRLEGRRTTTVYADLAPGADVTPLEFADAFERNVFPEVVDRQPSTTLAFAGEVFDTRESKDDFRNSIILVCLLVFAVLALLFNSLSRPLVIMLAIPFGGVGVVLAFLLHGKELFGFFAAIGSLGLAGVVVNDAIIMLNKLDQEFGAPAREQVNRVIASIAQTRLRAVVLTTLTTVAGVLPTAYGLAGYDAMLAEMMLALAWGLVFGTLITLLLVPCMYGFIQDLRRIGGRAHG
ncbi:MAG: efflux RND transporter permease subunit [Gammaproteobacteria bacterium]|nr:efflux RND transporter permease subunit [Gammaproteobacteria bacterium]